jgi:hypothetical protein
MKKRITLAIGILYSVVSAAQHEFSLTGTAGTSTIRMIHNREINSENDGMTFGAGLEYTYSLSPEFALITGIGTASFSSVIDAEEIDTRSEKLYSFAENTETMFFLSHITGFRESQKITYLRIPLMAQFSMSALNIHEWYIAAGAKFGFALSGNYKASADKITTSGYFPLTEQTFYNLPRHGFVTQDYLLWDGSLKLGFNILMSGEIGFRWTINDQWGLYTGAYIDYGLTDVSPKKNTELVEYQNTTIPETFTFNSIVTSKQEPDNTYVDKINLFSFGLKVKVAMRTKN